MGKMSTYLILIGLAAIFSVVYCSDSDLPELEVHNTFKPDACDRKAKPTDVLTVHYKGMLNDGSVFDSSHERNDPFNFQLGVGKVILGWEKGLLGTCAGEKIKLVVPPHLGYGDEPNNKIPARSTLTFEIEVLKIEDGPKPTNVFKEIDTDNDQRISRAEMTDFLKKQFQQMQHHGEPGMPSDDADQIHMVDEIFMHEDTDKDGFIGHDEFSGPKVDHDEL